MGGVVLHEVQEGLRRAGLAEIGYRSDGRPQGLVRPGHWRITFYPLEEPWTHAGPMVSNSDFDFHGAGRLSGSSTNFTVSVSSVSWQRYMIHEDGGSSSSWCQVPSETYDQSEVFS